MAVILTASVMVSPRAAETSRCGYQIMVSPRAADTSRCGYQIMVSPRAAETSRCGYQIMVSPRAAETSRCGYQTATVSAPLPRRDAVSACADAHITCRRTCPSAMLIVTKKSQSQAPLGPGLTHSCWL